MKKHQDMEGEGERRWTLRIPEQVPIAWKLTWWGSERTLDKDWLWAQGHTMQKWTIKPKGKGHIIIFTFLRFEWWKYFCTSGHASTI